jgi:hypothetical protein
LSYLAYPLAAETVGAREVVGAIVSHSRVELVGDKPVLCQPVLLVRMFRAAGAIPILWALQYEDSEPIALDEIPARHPKRTQCVGWDCATGQQ